MRFCSILCALLDHYNESGAFFLDLMRDLAHGAAQINPCALGLNTIIFKHVYWYMQQISGEHLQDHWSSGMIVVSSSLSHASSETA